MSAVGDGSASAYEWAVAQRPLPGEETSGDLSVVTPRRDGTLVAVVDGLGHGEEAAVAARAAVETLRSHPDEDLVDLVRRCHGALRRTRGAVVTLVLAGYDGRLRWTGVGNVQALIVRAEPGRPREHALVLSGVVGMDLPRVRAAEAALAPGDMIVLATDGIDAAFVDDLVAGPPQRTADEIMRRHGSGRDDALVLVGRYGGVRR